jgi:translation initiation factor IF-2
MRSRGVSVTDIVILVVAADDGVKEQTVEAINHTKAAGVPIIVAINKIDKEGADPTRVLRELLNHGIVTESMGGDVMVVEVSALKKLNLDKLEEAILVQAEVLNLKAYLDGKARGAVIESKMTQAKGVAATLLVQSGTLKKGDIVVAGIGWGKVKLLLNDKGKLLEEATPSMPVEVIGLDVAPHAGDTFAVVDGERQARSICEYRQKKRKEQKDVKRSKSSLEELFKAASKDADKTLPLIIKGDVQGSIEAISNTINKIDASEIKISILHEAVGGINESDVALAHASKAIIIGFNVRASNSAKTLIDRDNVDVRYYSIIYEAIDDIKRVLSGMLSPIISEQYLGKAEIRTVFNITNVGKIGGSFVLDGSLKRGSSVKLIRDNVVIHTGKLKTLKRFKDDVKEVASGYECGIGIEGYNDIKERDIVEAFEVVEQARTV